MRLEDNKELRPEDIKELTDMGSEAISLAYLIVREIAGKEKGDVMESRELFGKVRNKYVEGDDIDSKVEFFCSNHRLVVRILSQNKIIFVNETEQGTFYHLGKNYKPLEEAAARR